MGFDIKDREENTELQLLRIENSNKEQEINRLSVQIVELQRQLDHYKNKKP